MTFGIGAIDRVAGNGMLALDASPPKRVTREESRLRNREARQLEPDEGRTAFVQAPMPPE